MKRIGVIGAGTWGVALARMLCNAGNTVMIWSALEQEIDNLANSRNTGWSSLRGIGINLWRAAARIVMGRKIGENLKHIGNLDVDIMQRANGDYCVLELNPRFGGGYPFSYEAGVNMPKAIIQWVKGEEVNNSILKSEIGRMFAKNDYLMEIK